MQLCPASQNAGDLETPAECLDPIRETAESRTLHAAHLKASSVVRYLEHEVVSVSA
jgi:hypothetical protein